MLPLVFSFLYAALPSTAAELYAARVRVHGTCDASDEEDANHWDCVDEDDDEEEYDAFVSHRDMDSTATA